MASALPVAAAGRAAPSSLCSRHHNRRKAHSSNQLFSGELVFTHFTWGENPMVVPWGGWLHSRLTLTPKGQERVHWGENPWLYHGVVGFLAASFSPQRARSEYIRGENPWVYHGEVGFLAASFSPQRVRG